VFPARPPGGRRTPA